MKYFIHSCSSRMWYVENFLRPSLAKQGISYDNIIIWEDASHIGCLRSFIASVKYLVSMREEGLWHLQDDVIISPDFREQTEKVQVDSIVCGFCSPYDNNVFGNVSPQDMWHSFPCIYIPNFVLVDFYDWYCSYAVHDEQYENWIKDNKFDDSFFHRFVEIYYKKPINITNLCPNIVDHVDYLIGGSLVNRTRLDRISSVYWNYPELILELEEKINADK